MSDEKRYCQTCKDEDLDAEEGLCRTCRDLVSEGLHPMCEDLTSRGEVVMSNWRPKDKKPESGPAEERLCGDCADFDLPASSKPCRKCRDTRDKPNWRMKAGLLEKLRGIIETRTTERNNWRERCMRADSNLAGASKKLGQESKEVLRLTEERDDWRAKYATASNERDAESRKYDEVVKAYKYKLEVYATLHGPCEAKKAEKDQDLNTTISKLTVERDELVVDRDLWKARCKSTEASYDAQTSELEEVSKRYKVMSEHYNDFRVGVAKQILGMEKDRFKHASKKELLEQLKIAETEHASFFSMMRFLITKEEKC